MFAKTWVEDSHGSAAEFVQALEAQFGLPIRLHLPDILSALLDADDLKWWEREYLEATLSADRISEAMTGKPVRSRKDVPSLDELFSRSTALRSSAKFAEAISFVSRFRRYSPFNNLLVYLQNPNATFWALPRYWEERFDRRVKDDARPMIILAPMTPVLLVYDVVDTEGSPLPEWFADHFTVEGNFDDQTLHQTIENCKRDRIQVLEKQLSFIHGGTAIKPPAGGNAKMTIELNQEFDSRAKYASLSHELGHIHLGHLGSDSDGWWPSRMNLSRDQREIEAEAVAYIVCRRAGLTTHSAEYLVGYSRDPGDLTRISIDLITKVAGLIEQMGEKRLPERRPRGQQQA